MRGTKKLWSVLVCVILIMTMLLGMTAMAATMPSAEEQASMNNHHELVGLTGVQNARDLGGYITSDGQYQVKYGKLFRTAKLYDATDEDLALLQSLGVSKVIDLRMHLEALTKPDKKIPGAKTVSISTQTIPNIFVITGEDWSAMLKAIKTGVMDTYMANMYRQLVQDPLSIYGTKRFFKELLASNGEPVLWHCTSGKDRTGIEAMLLLAALGVTDEDVLRAEHMNTNYFMAEKAQANYDKAYSLTHSDWIASEFYKYEGVRDGSLDIALNIIHRYGSIQDYLKKAVGLTEEDFQQLRDAYLEPVAEVYVPAA